MSTLRQFIQLVCEDSTRRNTGAPFDLYSHLKKFISETEPPEYFFTMTDLPKVGLNPQSRYNTPIGVYTYPLNAAFLQMLVNDELPFQSEAPYVSVVRAKDPEHMLRVSKSGPGILSQEEFHRIMDSVTRQVFHVPYDDCDEEIAGQNNFSNYNLDAKLYGAFFVCTRNYNQKHGSTRRKEHVAWNRLFQQAGITAIYDHGAKVIHTHEPTQCVFLSARAYSVVGTWRTADLRRHQGPVSHINQKIFDKAFNLGVPIIKLINPKLWPTLSESDASRVIDYTLEFFNDTGSGLPEIIEFLRVNKSLTQIRASEVRRIIACCAYVEGQYPMLGKIRDVIDANRHLEWPPTAHFLMMGDFSNSADPIAQQLVRWAGDLWYDSVSASHALLKFAAAEPRFADMLLDYDQTLYPNIRHYSVLDFVQKALHQT